MEKNEVSKTGSGLDVVGLGKAAEAVPKEVYIEVAGGLIENFNKIIAPITETTSGVGRYIRQKFDNMVETEKAIAAVTLQESIRRAQERSSLILPKHIKSFVNSIEEASRETDPILHEMWVNALSKQITNSKFHPRYVSMLASFSADEANLLMSLNTVDNLGKDFSIYFGSPRHGFDHFVLKNHDTDLHEWTYACNILLEFDLAEVMAPNEGIYEQGHKVTILYLTNSGKRFLDVVTS